MWAVVYVVALTDTNPERIALNRAGIRSILSDDCLRDSAVVIVLNTFGMGIESLPLPPEEMIARLGLYEAEGAISSVADRLAWYVVNAKEGERDEQWMQAFHFMLAHFAKMAAIKAEPVPREDRKTGGGGGGGGGGAGSQDPTSEDAKKKQVKKKK